MTTLTQQLKEQVEGFKGRAPKEVQDIMARATKELETSDVAKGLKEGEVAPDFTLPNAVGENVTLYQQLEKGPVIVTFYRGEWCPYCNLELKSYQDELPAIQAAGANVIAISPETPDHSLSIKEKHDLAFDVLSDTDKSAMDAYNLVFKMPDYLIDLYKQLNLNLDQYNVPENAWELPVPATFVIGQDRIIKKAAVNPDYTTRLDPKEALAALS
ncbi:peroxiredoxin-like family protein [Mangrovibacillus cuniculi]|uniref:thioredoxin-dependent peroxiredoxin n=1 Tax=Mangrovibacillus cuniculi TaxID=2593652 RepID=A0A7S8CCL4_9BACI|nr:peroxiredoxin-like family protein [Mangrovibacillus cuniculi]QPC47493.1 AhpC/TSA family protein [Mangrovibacillus cuniculi]